MSLEQPNYHNPDDRDLYQKLINRGELSEIESDFVRTMYHMEEFACGLEGGWDDDE